MITIITRVVTPFNAMTGSYPHSPFNYRYNVFTRVILSPKIYYKVCVFLALILKGLGRGTGRVLLKVTLSRQG